jgi:hypothetical protein
VWDFNKGASERQPWFGCSCCPTNIVRFIPSLPGYAYAQDGDVIYVNLFMGSEATVNVNGQAVKLIQKTRYPWDGKVELTVQTDSPIHFELRVRIPGWAQGHPVPGDLYCYANGDKSDIALTVNDESVDVVSQKGFACLQREWQNNDVVTLNLSMPVQCVLSHENAETNAGRLAVERGPIVFCAEAIDNEGGVGERVLADDVAFVAEFQSELLNGVVKLTSTDWTLIPYYAWCHRGANEMAVWLRSMD